MKIYMLLAFIAVVVAKDCIKELEKSNNSPLLGRFVPKCKSDGTYEQVQFHEGTFFCVVPKTGDEILGTRSRSHPTSCELTACFKSRHQGMKLEQMGLLGVPVPRCDEIGQYSRLQCHKGMCWCADPSTGHGVGSGRTDLTIEEC